MLLLQQGRLHCRYLAKLQIQMNENKPHQNMYEFEFKHRKVKATEMWTFHRQEEKYDTVLQIVAIQDGDKAILNIHTNQIRKQPLEGYYLQCIFKRPMIGVPDHILMWTERFREYSRDTIGSTAELMLKNRSTNSFKLFMILLVVNRSIRSICNKNMLIIFYLANFYFCLFVLLTLCIDVAKSLFTSVLFYNCNNIVTDIHSEKIFELWK